MAGRDTAEVLQAAEGSFNAPAILVALLIISDSALAIDTAGMIGLIPSALSLLRKALAS